MSDGYVCPVCGWPKLETDAAIEDYNICPCCGIEFGAYTAYWTYAEMREFWVDGGMKWWAKFEPAPPNWNPQEQLDKLLAANPPLAGPYYREEFAARKKTL